MRSRIVLGVCMGALLTGSLSADTRFTGAVSELWSDPANWTAGLPDPADKVQYDGGKLCILDYDAGVIKNNSMEGGGTTNLRLVKGAKLAASDWTIIGYAGAPADPHLLEVFGGVYNANMRTFVGFQGKGKLVVDYAGVFNLNGQELGIGEAQGGDGIVEIRGGSLNLLSTSLLPLRFRAGASSQASMDFRGGVMKQAFSQARLNVINTNIANGTIKAYKGVGTVIVENVKNQLIVSGLHPLKPVPGDGENVGAKPGALTLGWTSAAGMSVDVWFGTSADLSEAKKIVNKQIATSATVTVDRKNRYYWAVDTYTSGATEPNLGPIFDFYVDNLPPDAEAGDNIPTWLAKGSVEIAGTVKDADLTTSRWTLTAFDPNDPNRPGTLNPVTGPISAAIANADQLATTVTFAALGTYQLKLEATDGEYTGSDTMLIKVFSTPCQAAKSLPGYTPIPGDINGDCVVDDKDLAILQGNWGQCNGLDCPK